MATITEQRVNEGKKLSALQSRLSSDILKSKFRFRELDQKMTKIIYKIDEKHNSILIISRSPRKFF